METLTYRLAKWLSQRSRTARTLWAAFVTAITFYFGRVLSEQIAATVKVDQPYAVAFHAAFFVVLLIVIVFLFRLMANAIDRYQEDVELEKATILHAYNLCDRITVGQASAIEDAHSPIAALEILATPRSADGIQKVVQAAYQTFESAYGKASSSEDRVDFEVTFMTTSFVDDKITIPAAANKDGRMPRSMELRKAQPDIYDNSVTADLYRAQSPRIKIVQNTETREYEYKELYPNQKNRIKSSVVFPVLFNRNRLLGTLVVHCDKTNFFLLTKEKYWADLLEIFSKRIALEVQVLRAAQRFCAVGEPFTPATKEHPY